MKRFGLLGLVAGFIQCAMAQEPAAPATPVGDDMHPRVKMETSLGTILLELDAEKAPITVDNFVRYVEAGFYNGTIFHRVVPDFMIQGGGFTVDLTEKKDGLRPGIRNEWQNGLKNGRGTISMARVGGNPDSGTAQFFINVVDNDRLDKPQRDGAAYAVFGKVVEGMDVVDKIRNVETKQDPKLPMGKVVPVEPVVIKGAALTSPFGRDKVAAKVKAAEEAAAAARAAETAAREQALAGVIQKVESETGKKVEKSGSGLMWVVLKEGSGASPQPTDTVEVHYTGWLVNGKEFDSSAKHGGPATFPLNRVIKGWTEGVGLMKVGEKRKFIIPSELAYGKRGSPPDIGPDATLIFDVELLGIK